MMHLNFFFFNVNFKLITYLGDSSGRMTLAVSGTAMSSLRGTCIKQHLCFNLIWHSFGFIYKCYAFVMLVKKKLRQFKVPLHQKMCFLFSFLQLNIWALLCRMMHVQSIAVFTRISWKCKFSSCLLKIQF